LGMAQPRSRRLPVGSSVSSCRSAVPRRIRVDRVPRGRRRSRGNISAYPITTNNDGSLTPPGRLSRAGPVRLRLAEPAAAAAPASSSTVRRGQVQACHGQFQPRTGTLLGVPDMYGPSHVEQVDGHERPGRCRRRISRRERWRSAGGARGHSLSRSGVWLPLPASSSRRSWSHGPTGILPD
jgi:hypothetical protein